MAIESANPDTFDIRGSLRRMIDASRHHKKLVLLTCLGTLLLVTLYVYFWPPIYTANAMVMAERDTDPMRDSFYVTWDVFRKEDAKTEIEVMTSSPVLKEVVRREKLTYNDVYHPFMSHLTYLWGKSLVGRTYRAVKRRVFPPPPGMPSEAEQDLARTLVDLKEGISVTPVLESNTGRVTVLAPTRRAAAIANTLLDVYAKARNDRFRAEAQQSYDILTEQLQLAEQGLEAVEKKRLAFVQANDLIFEFQKDAADVQKLSDIEGAVTTSRVRQATMEASLAEIESQLRKDPPTETNAVVRQALNLKRIDLQAALLGISSRYREDSPEVQEARRSLGDLDALIARGEEPAKNDSSEGLTEAQQELVSKRNALESDLRGVDAGLGTMHESVAQMRERLSKMAAMQVTMRRFDREYAVVQQKFNQLQQKQGQAAATLATIDAVVPSLRVVEYAAVPIDATWPKLKYLYPGALLVGLLLGVGAAALVSLTSGRVGRDHVEGGRGDTPLYGAIAVGRRPPVLTVTQRRRAGAESPGAGPS